MRWALVLQNHPDSRLGIRLTDEANCFKAARSHDLPELSNRACRKDYALRWLYFLGYPNQFSSDYFSGVYSCGAFRYWYVVFDLGNVFFNLLHAIPALWWG